ncbi:MAG TPA: BNR-4 repeat-containing protein [Phycisphaerae bacterium]|nr:BNR-4 repeat-containing protein [Phycisphaerae bacterium]
MPTKTFSHLLIAMAACACVPTLHARADLIPEKQIVTINDNAAWCWFQDERVLADHGKLIVSSVASQGGPGGAARSGNIEVTTFEPYTDQPGFNGKSTVSVLRAKLQEDDHDAAGMTILPDGRYLAMYSKHIADKFILYRISSKPGEATAWEPEKTLTRDSNVTYNNIYHLSDENRLYDFYRGEHYKPNFLTSDDNGQTWTYGNPVVHIAADPQDKMRPYARYASNYKDTIWIANTDAHPAEYPATSLYLMYMKGGKLYHPNGTELAPLSKGVEPAQELCIFKGDPQNQAWVCQLQLDKDGMPCIAYSIHKTDQDLRYRFYDAKNKLDLEFAHAGNFLYKSQEHYTGNVAVDPLAPHTLYFSTNADPKTGEPLISKADGKRHWELYRCILAPNSIPNNGPGGGIFDLSKPANWLINITPLTENSTVDNIRPIIPAGDHSVRALLWMRGTYTSYTRWTTAAVAAPLPSLP